MTKDYFIQKAEEMYGIGKYDFSKVPNEIVPKEKIELRCIIHNITFITRAGIFFKNIKNACPECYRLERQRLFIEKATILHNGIYDYSLVYYINSKTKVKIICKEHGVFEMMPNSHLCG